MSLRVIWQYMDRSVTKQYYMDLRTFGPYNIFLVTDQSIYRHMTLSAMNYLLYMYCFQKFRFSLISYLFFSNTLAMLRDWNSLDRFRKYAFLLIEGYVIHNNIIYYTLRLYFPYLSLIASRSIY